MSSGHIGARIVWVKLRGFTCDMCVVGVYIPHRFRKRAPFQTDTLQELREFLHTIPSSMQVVVAGDFNAKLARNMEGIVGKYAMHPRCDEGGSELASIMRETDLVAASTYFRPKASQSLGNATYVNSKSQAKQTASQIDYILVSGRRKSSVLKCGTAWSAAIHRYGWKYDHCLLYATVTFKVRAVTQREPVVDWESLRLEKAAQEFDAAYERARRKLELRRHLEAPPDSTPTEPDGTEQLRMMTTALQEAKETVPKKGKCGKRERRRSERTESLFADRERALQAIPVGSEYWKKVRALYRNRINHSCRRDYRDYVEGVVQEIEKADESGNARAVWQGVYRLGGGKKRGPARQPTIDERGEEIRSSMDLAEAWRAYAERKFACTQAELERPSVRDLGSPDLRRGEPPTDEELDSCLRALKNSKACGPDGIPVEAYKASPNAKRDLFAFVKWCWEEEVVPEELPKGTFITMWS